MGFQKKLYICKRKHIKDDDYVHVQHFPKGRIAQRDAPFV